MPVFLLGRLETPYPMRLANTKDDWKALYLLFGTHQGSFTVTAPVIFPIKISALTQNEKDASGSSALSLWSGDFSCFSWLSKNLTLLPSRWSETLICLLLPPSRTCLSVTPYLLAPFFHYLLRVFLQSPCLANLEPPPAAGAGRSCSAKFALTLLPWKNKTERLSYLTDVS